VVNSYLVDALRKLGLWNKDILDKIKVSEGSIQKIKEIPKKIRDLYKEAFEVDPRKCIELTAIRGKWVDQAQSHNVFVSGVSGKAISDLYIMAWKYGLKSCYYLRTLAATSNEKATLDTVEITQQRDAKSNLKACRIDDPDCQSCQ
jgi:ribonucleoside-diphosphate reductase alpha chain